MSITYEQRGHIGLITIGLGLLSRLISYLTL